MLIAAVQGAVVLIYSAQSTVESQAVAERISALPLESRWLTVATSDAGVDLRAASTNATRALRRLSGHPVAAHLVFGPLSDRRGGRFQLIGSDSLRRELRLVSGRWPAACTSGCEAVAVGPKRGSAPAGIRIVGRAEFAAGSALRLGLAADTPVLAVSDASGLLATSAYGAVPHALQWLTSIDTGAIDKQGIAAYIAQVLRESDRLSLLDARLHLVAPTTQLSASAGQVLALQQRMLGLALCLVLICIYAVHRIALARRNDHRLTARRVRESGWSRASRVQFALATAVMVVAPGVIIGSLWGAAVGVLLFGRHGAPPAALWVWTAAIVATALVSILTALQAPITRAILALGCGAWIVAAWTNGYDTEVLVLSTAGAVVAALVTHLPVPWRITPFTLNLMRANGQRLRSLTVVAGFLVAFTMGSVSSLETLQQGVRDAAVFESPLAARIAWGDRLPLQAHSLTDFERMSAGGAAFAVHTVRATIRQSLVDATPLQVMGVEPAVWSRVPDFSGQSGIPNATIARVLGAQHPEPGVTTAGARLLTGQASGLVPTVALSVWLLDRDGEAQQRVVHVGADGRFQVALEPSTASILGFALDELPQAAAHRAHAVGEGISTLAAPHGTLQLRDLALDGVALQSAERTQANAPSVRVTRGAMRWTYALVGGSGWAPLSRPPRALRAVVDPVTAALAQDGVLAVRFSDSSVVPIRVAAVAQRIPAAASRFVVIDDDALVALLAADAPSLLRVSEIWLTRPLSAASVGSGALVGLTVTTRADAIALRAASSASTWSARTLELLVVLCALLFIAFVGMSLRDILAHAELEGWEAQGLPRRRTTQGARRVVVGLVAAASTGVLAMLAVLIPAVLGRANVDITGNPSVPPLHATMPMGLMLLVLVGAPLLAAFSSWEPRALRRLRGGP